MVFWTAVIASYQSLRSDWSIWKILLCDWLFVVGREVYYVKWKRHVSLVSIQVSDCSIWMSHVVFWMAVIASYQSLCSYWSIWKILPCDLAFVLGSEVYYRPIRNLDGNEANPFKGTNQKPGWKRGWRGGWTWRHVMQVSLKETISGQPLKSWAVTMFWWKLTSNCLSRGRGGAFFLLLVAVWLERPYLYQEGGRWWCFMSERTSKILVPFEIAKHRLQAGGCLRRYFPRKD